MSLAAALLAAGVVLESRDLALLSMLPLAAYLLNAFLKPPGASASARRAGGRLEVYVQTDGRPGVVRITAIPRLDASAPPARRVVFAPPFRRTISARLPLRAPLAAVVVETYNPALTRRALYVRAEAEEPRGPPPATRGLEEFYELRPYQMGDSPRLINWRAYAKTGELYVNKLVGAEERRAVVIVDARRLRAQVVEAAYKAAEILAEAGYAVMYYAPGLGVLEEMPAEFSPSCSGEPPCGDLTVYVGSLRDVCPARCPRLIYVDVAGANPLAAIRRIGLYKELRSKGAVVLTSVEEIKRYV